MQGIASCEKDSCRAVCGSAYKSSKSAQCIPNPAITPTPALLKAPGAPERADGEGGSPRFREAFGAKSHRLYCTVREQNHSVRCL